MCSFKDSFLSWLLLIAFLFLVNSSMAQLYPVSSQYIYHGIVINPAESGKDGALSMSLGYRNQWLGFEGSPKTISASVHAPLGNDKVGLGLLILSDSYGIISHTNFRGNYAYRIEMGNGILAFGLSASIIRMDVSPSKLIAEDPDDDFFNYLAESTTQPNFGAGIYYRANNYFVGFSVPQLLAENRNISSVSNNSISDHSGYSYFGYGGYQIRFHPHFSFEPSMLVRYFKGNALQFDITPQLGISDKIWIGANYRTEGAMTALLRCKIDHQISLGYSYDFEIGNKQRYLNNSHEIMLKYILKYKTQVVSPR